MSLFHLYAAYAIVPTQELRYTHVAFTLVLSFLLFPLATRFRNRVRWWDVVPGIFAVATIAYALWGGEDFTDRATSPERWTSSSASFSSCCCWRRPAAPPG